MQATANRPSGATLRALVQPKSTLPTALSMCHLGLRWSAHPNPTWHIWMPSSGSCAASEPAIHEVAPSGAPATPPPAPAERASTLSDGEKQRHQPLQCPDSNRSGRQPPTHHGVATRAPPFTAQTARDRPSGGRVPRPTETECGPQPPFWGWCQPRPYSVPVQRLGVATRRWLGSSTALCAKPST